MLYAGPNLEVKYRLTNYTHEIKFEMAYDNLRNMAIENNYSKDVDISILRIFYDDYFAKSAYEDKSEYEAIASLTHIKFVDVSHKNNMNTLSIEFPIVKKLTASFKCHDHKHLSRDFLEDARHNFGNVRLFSAAIFSRLFFLFLGILTRIKSLTAEPCFMGCSAVITGTEDKVNSIHIDIRRQNCAATEAHPIASRAPQMTHKSRIALKIVEQVKTWP